MSRTQSTPGVGVNTSTCGPFRGAATDYLKNGWSPLPLPLGAKYSPPNGFTGHSGKNPTDDQITEWISTQGDGNVAIRVPDDVVGLDIDAYDGKDGAATLAEHEATLGALPDTFRSSARPSPSGILFVRVPAGFRSHPALGPGVDIVQRSHRYAVVAPSLHPEGLRYQWFGPDGSLLDGVPAVADLPELPEKWLDELRTETTEVGETTPEAVDLFYGSLSDPHGTMCRRVRAASYRCRNEFVGHRWQGSRHDAAMHAVHDLQHLGAQGHRGALTGLELIHDAYLLAKTTYDPMRPQSVAEGEWHRLAYGTTGVAIVLAKLGSGALEVPEHGCACDTEEQRSISVEDAFAGLPGVVVNRETESDVESSPSTPSLAEWADEPAAVREELYRLQVRERARELFEVFREGQAPGDADLFEVTDWDSVEEESSPPLMLGDLVYERGTLWISGEGGSGKTFFAFWVLAQLVRKGHVVGVYECESGPAMIKGRLLNLGLTAEEIKTYVRDYRSRNGNTVTDLVRHGKTLAERMGRDGAVAALFDAAAPLLSACDLDEDNAKDIRRWVTRALRPVTDDLSALALVIDHTGHVEKNRPRGSSDKKPANDHMVLVESARKFAIGQDGLLKLTCTKDRWGRIGEKSNCLIHVSTGGDESLDLLPAGWRPPSESAGLVNTLDGAADSSEAAILAFLGVQNRPCTAREVVDGTGLTKDTVYAKLRRLGKANKVSAQDSNTADGRSVKQYTVVTECDFLEGF